MLKLLAPDIFVYDAEWVIDPLTCRLVYGLPAEMSDQAVIEHAYAEARAKQERAGRVPDERPFVKTSLCRIVAISAVKRVERRGQVKLTLKSLPAVEGMLLSERDIVDKFLGGVGAVMPQLVGYNCRQADMPILLQRAIAYGLHQPEFGKRPKKSWEGVDYFTKYSDFHVDLMDIVSNSSFGSSTPSLHEICVASGIPGKFLAGGDDVAALWLEGRMTRIVQYNQCDVLSQYELLMRVALLAGLIEPAAYAEEQRVFGELLGELIAAGGAIGSHINEYVTERQRLRHALNPPAPEPVAAPVLELV